MMGKDRGRVGGETERKSEDRDRKRNRIEIRRDVKEKK